jgi:hypothetical protein
VDASKKLVRAGLKTIVVMAGGCALQANPRVVQPRSGGCTTKLFINRSRRDYYVRNEFTLENKRSNILGSPPLSRFLRPGGRKSKHESRFKNATRLSGARAISPESKTRGHAARVHNRQISTQEKRVLAVGRRHRERERVASRAV